MRKEHLLWFVVLICVVISNFAIADQEILLPNNGSINRNYSQEKTIDLVVGTEYYNKGETHTYPGYRFVLTAPETDIYHFHITIDNGISPFVGLYKVTVMSSTMAEYEPIFSEIQDSQIDPWNGTEFHAFDFDVTLEKDSRYELSLNNNGKGTWVDTQDWPLNGYSITVCSTTNHATLSDTWFVQDKPTCTQNGKQIKVCGSCSKTVQEEVLIANGHDDKGEWKTTKEPTCSQNGIMTLFCLKCNEQLDKQEISSLPHTPSEMIMITAPTCSIPGLKCSFCIACGEEITREAIMPFGHEAGDWSVEQQSTCEVEGESVIRCTKCNEIISKKSIPALGHTPGEFIISREPFCINEGLATKNCILCTATLETKAIEAKGHNIMDWQITREPTCITSGMREKICSTCQVSIEQEEMEAFGHQYTEYVSVVEATKDTDGVEIRYCIRCGDTQSCSIPSGTYMTWAEYDAAALESEVNLICYVQTHQSWWDNKVTVYAADKDGAYFLYNMACTEEDAARLVPGTKIAVKGFKNAWAGEVEVVDASFGFVDDGDTFVAEAIDMTELLANADELIKNQNKFVAFKGMTVVPSKMYGDETEYAFLYAWDGSGSHAANSDLYFNVALGDAVYNFTVESYLCDMSTDVYATVENLKVGDVVDMEGFLYWYNDVNPHITRVVVK